MTTANLVNSDLTRSIPYSSYSMEFDGTADVVTIGSTSLGITSAISISAWVKTTDTASSYKVIFCEDNTSGTNRSWNLFVNSSRKLSFIVWNTDGSLNYLVRTNIDEVQDGNWHHVVATYDGTTNADGIKLYVDGSPESMTATSTGIRTTASLEPTIGGLTNSGGWYWPGSLSNIGVWSSALTQDQILTIYNGGVPNDISSLSPIGWWSLSGDSYFDGTTNADGIKLYVDGSPESMTATSTGIRTTASLEPTIGGLTNSGGWYWPGSLSNIGVWSSALTQDQILTIYNGGVPNDISSLSPIGWWSLSGDSYFDGTNWICPDLGSGGNNGTSDNMGGTELIGDGPGSSANGIATSMDIPTNLKGNAPNSSKNAFSTNMTPVDRVTSVPG